MKYALAVLALALVACSPDSTSTTAPRLVHPSFAMDLTAPAAPSNVSAAVTSDDGVTATVAFQWEDNTTALDEFNTCAEAFNADGSAAGGGCAYASDYDTPAGSTGARSGQVSVMSSVATLRLVTWRRFQQEDGWWRNVASAYSETVAVAPLATAATAKRRGKK